MIFQLNLLIPRVFSNVPGGVMKYRKLIPGPARTAPTTVLLMKIPLFLTLLWTLAINSKDENSSVIFVNVIQPTYI